MKIADLPILMKFETFYIYKGLYSHFMSSIKRRFPLGKGAKGSRSAPKQRRIVRRVNLVGVSSRRMAGQRLRAEVKTYDPVVLSTNLLYADTTSAVAVSASGYITTASSAHVLNQVPQDATSTGRIGRRITMKSIHLKGSVIGPTAAGQNSGPVRMCLVYIPVMDRTVTTMPPQNVIWTSQDARQLRVLNNAHRFRIIRQWSYNVAGDSDAPTTGLEVHQFDLMVKLGLDTVWTQANTSGTFDAMEEGALCLYVQGYNTAGATTSAIINYVARIYFSDK